MQKRIEFAPSPWQWTEFGVLSDANGEAILDTDNWDVSPENAALIQAAPVLYEGLTAVRSRLSETEFENKDRIIAFIDQTLYAALMTRKV